MTDKPPTISVVMCVYNGEAYLVKSLESVLNQTFTDFEFIIVDDGSTDGTPKILDKYQKADDRIIIIKNKRNIGLGSSLQIGIGQARGSYIARMDADDISSPERFEKQLNYIEAHPNIMVLGCDHEIINDDGELISTLQYPKDPNLMRWNMLLGSGYIVSNGATFIRKELFTTIGSYSDLIAAQDYELWTRLFNYDPLPIANMDEMLYRYRVHGQTTTNLKNNIQEENAIRIRLEIIGAFLGENIPRDVLLSYRYPSYTYHNIMGCIQTWIKLYKKFCETFRVDRLTRESIRNEMIVRLNKYSYIPPQKKNIKFRVSLWKLLAFLPSDFIIPFILYKSKWVFSRI